MSRIVWRYSPERLLELIRPVDVLPHQPVTFLAVRYQPFDGGYVEVLVDDPMNPHGATYEGEIAPWMAVDR